MNDPRTDPEKGLAASPGGVDGPTLDQAYDPPFRGFFIGGAGDVTVETLDGSTLTLVAPAAGVMHLGLVISKFTAATTATDIVGLY